MRPLQILAIINTPQSHVADALYRVRELRLGERVYPITTYFAATDNSSKGIVPGIVLGTSSSTLVEERVAPATINTSSTHDGSDQHCVGHFRRIEGPIATYASTGPSCIVTPIDPDKWFARFACSWVIGITIALHQTLSYARRAAPTTSPSRIRALPNANPVTDLTLR
ncbi:hypothetical protein HPB51_012126 [Rhipicephalus microplus]|uniref:Uncharacterized protein n=1 Tax=Rhipicephalus microplus TaxID=6941 RepID=A0A9J6DUR5_RHIMP|nr:hypothetical protein HPB51_012126 [Rhipicephalus microplus]